MLGVNPNLFACLMLLFRSPSVPGCTKLLELEDQRIDVDHGWKIPSGLQPSFFEPAIATCSGGKANKTSIYSWYILLSHISTRDQSIEIMPGLLFLFLWRTRRACEIAGRRPRLGAMLVWPGCREEEQTTTIQILPRDGCKQLDITGICGVAL